MRRPLRVLATTALSIVGVVLVWVVVKAVGGLDDILLPAPQDVASAALDERGALATAARTTLLGAIGGFVVGNLAGVVLAIVVAWSVTASRVVLPLALVVRVVPIIAIAPLLTLILGRGLVTVTTIAALIVFFPTLVNGVLGLRSVDAKAVEMMRMANASTWQVFRHVRLPAAMPSLFSAFQVAAASSVLGAMVAEWAASGAGLGYLILQAGVQFETDLMWAGVILATLLALAASALTTVVGRRVVGWQDTA
jgi:ABC-type nitrate/sulfonate/bicarbonate transport system permease component